MSETIDNAAIREKDIGANNTMTNATPGATTATNGHTHAAHQRHGHLQPLPGGMAVADAGSLHPGMWRPFEHRKLANPAPLGLSAFALTTFVLSAINMHARNVTAPNIILTLAFGYGGLVQLLAGMWEMACGNTFGATALSSYGGFWISFAFILVPDFNFFGADGPYAGDLNSPLGFFLIGWFIFTFLMLLCTLRSTVAFFLLFFFLDLAFLMLACQYFAADNGAMSMSVGLQKAGGFFGFLAAFLAWYNALAGIQDDSNSFFQVPVFHLPWSDKGRALRQEKTEREMA